MTIDTSEALIGFSQLALGLAGFSSILVALSGSPSLWTHLESFRIKNMLVISFLTVFTSLVPISLGLFGMTDAVMWQVALVAIALVTTGVALVAFRDFRRLSGSDREVTRPLYVYLILAILLAASIIELTAGLYKNAAAPGIFFTGLLLLLGLCVYLVLRFLFARPSA